MSAVQHIIDTMLPITGFILQFIYYNKLSFLNSSVSIYTPYSSIRASCQKINSVPRLHRKPVYLLLPARFHFVLGVLCVFSFSYTLQFVVLDSGSTDNTCRN